MPKGMAEWGKSCSGCGTGTCVTAWRRRTRRARPSREAASSPASLPYSGYRWEGPQTTASPGVGTWARSSAQATSPARPNSRTRSATSTDRARNSWRWWRPRPRRETCAARRPWPSRSPCGDGGTTHWSPLWRRGPVPVNATRPPLWQRGSAIPTTGGAPGPCWRRRRRTTATPLRHSGSLPAPTGRSVPTPSTGRGRCSPSRWRWPPPAATSSGPLRSPTVWRTSPDPTAGRHRPGPGPRPWRWYWPGRC